MRLILIIFTFICVNYAQNQKVTRGGLLTYNLCLLCYILKVHLWIYNSQQFQIQVTVYYESLCPYSAAFIRDQLAPAHEPLQDYIDILFVPFGKSIVSK